MRDSLKIIVSVSVIDVYSIFPVINLKLFYCSIVGNALRYFDIEKPHYISHLLTLITLVLTMAFNNDGLEN